MVTGPKNKKKTPITTGDEEIDRVEWLFFFAVGPNVSLYMSVFFCWCLDLCRSTIKQPPKSSITSK